MGFFAVVLGFFAVVFLVDMSNVEMCSFCLLTSMELILDLTTACICILRKAYY